MTQASNLTIAVTGMNATDNPGPGVPIIRAIRASEEFTGTIVGIAYDPLDPGVYMDDICDHVYLCPYPSEGSEAILARIEEIHFKTPIDILIPALDSELQTYINIETRLEGLGIKMFLPTKSGLKIRSKAHFAALADAHGIRVPRGKPITNVQAIHELEREFSYPVMIKGQFYDARVAYSTIEAEQSFRQISAKWGLPIVVQEYISGEEYDVIALGDGKGGLVGAVPMRKMQLTEKGKAWGGITIFNQEMTDFVEQIMNTLKWRGPCELEIMRSHDDAELYLLEINPRFPAWCYLSVGAGQNLPWATAKLAAGEHVDPFNKYEVGTLFLRHSVDMVYPISKYQEMTTAGEVHNVPLPMPHPSMNVLYGEDN